MVCLGILRAYSEKETVTAKEKPPPAVPVHIYFTISLLKWCDSHSDAVVVLLELLENLKKFPKLKTRQTAFGQRAILSARRVS